MQSLHVVKIGGNIIDDPLKLYQFLEDFSALDGLKVLVHGGGKIASAIGQQLGIEPKMMNGRRITDEETLRIVTMVYGGLVNKNVVAQLQAFGCDSIGLTGADANIIQATKRPVGEINYGFAGDIKGPESINTAILTAFLQNSLTPVLAPLTHNGQGTMLNTNADTIASSIAVALAQNFDVHLMYCFEKKGVLRDVNDDASVISSVSKEEYAQLKEEGIIAAGMIPKLDNAMKAIQEGVQSVYICHADDVLEIVKHKAALGTKLYT
ncbi:acetylglutamate kinase [Pontibacter silvestris]|uniref:Acetylglutamate kinase n=1 Tax=Pontibacter silvestris TaxID=2305183 RepID=A0ABW4WXT4_9BACT|nr:acetylglutamate kinase [Pontibacter silvestris]MCC9135335.1 acetylglutamate kinase [Pontibacter silvestris]